MKNDSETHNKLMDLFGFIEQSRDYEEIIFYCLENDLMEFLKDYQNMIIEKIKELKKTD